jgi:hypothetical protein
MTDADVKRLEGKLDTLISLMTLITPRNKVVQNLADKLFPLQSYNKTSKIEVKSCERG